MDMILIMNICMVGFDSGSSPCFYDSDRDTFCSATTDLGPYLMGDYTSGGGINWCIRNVCSGTEPTWSTIMFIGGVGRGGYGISTDCTVLLYQSVKRFVLDECGVYTFHHASSKFSLLGCTIYCHINVWSSQPNYVDL